jgi:hypothetical protein
MIMKKAFRFMACTMLIVLTLSVFSFAANVQLTLNKDAAKAGDTIELSGTADANTWVSIKVIDGKGAIVFFDGVKSTEDGSYTASFKVPDVSEGVLKVIAGYGENIASKDLKITTGDVLLIPPTLKVEQGENKIGESMLLTFTDNATWRSAISNITVDGVAISKDQYTIEAGKICIHADVFKEAKDYVMVVYAKGYEEATIHQNILPSEDGNLTLTLSKDAIQVGETVTISGTATPNGEVEINVKNKDQQIVFSDKVKTDEKGNYIAEFPIPDMPEGVLKVTVVCDGQTMSKDLKVSIDECFIATAAYGSKFEPHVVLLRSFRDQFLRTNPIGEAFVRFYYHNSPSIAKFIAGNGLLKGLTRALLMPFVCCVYMLFHPLFGCLMIGLSSILFIKMIRRRKRTIL